MELSASGVGVITLLKEFSEFELASEERTRFHQEFASYDNNSLTVEELLGYLGSESAEQVASAINYYLLFEHA